MSKLAAPISDGGLCVGSGVRLVEAVEGLRRLSSGEMGRPIEVACFGFNLLAGR